MSVLTLDIERATIRPGIIAPNEDGVYKIIVGGLNIYSPNGFYYKYTEKTHKALTSGAFKIKLEAGKVKSEDNHPNFSEIPTDAGKVARMLKIDDDNAVGVIVDVEVIKSDKLDPIFGEPVYYIVASIKPEGPKANVLIKLLEDPNAELCFSVRSFSDKYEKNGIMVKEQKLFVTWDRVTNPGHYVAKKSYTNANTLDIESVDEYVFTELEIKNIRTELLDKLDTEIDVESINELTTLLDVFTICDNGENCIYHNL